MKYRLPFMILLVIASLSITACSAPVTPTLLPSDPQSSSAQPQANIQPATTPSNSQSNPPSAIKNTPGSSANSSNPYYDDGGSTTVGGATSGGSALTTGPENLAFFQDSLATADLFVLNLTAVNPAPSGQAYHGWLRNEDGSLTAVGLLDPQSDGTLHLEWASPDGKNLVASVTGFQITLEPAGGVEQPTGKVVFAGEMTPEQVVLARSLFVSNTGQPATPRNKAFALALVQQMNLALAHADNGLNAEAIGAAAERSLHMEHYINILEGSKGERFKDYDGDGSPQNPGDGFGVVAYAQQIQEKLANPEITNLVEQVTAALINLEQQVIAILESQPGAPLLKDVRQATEDVQLSLVFTLYRLAEQAVAFPVVAVP